MSSRETARNAASDIASDKSNTLSKYMAANIKAIHVTL